MLTSTIEMLGMKKLDDVLISHVVKSENHWMVVGGAIMQSFARNSATANDNDNVLLNNQICSD